VLRAGLALMRHGQLVSAERCFQTKVALRPDTAGWFYLGASQHALGRLAEAADSFGKSASLAANPADALCARATVLAALGREQEAEQDLRRAVEASPQHAQALFNLAVVLEARGAKADALSFYDRALEADPKHDAARINRGALSLALGQGEAALADFDLLAQSPTATVDVLNNRSRALFALHRDGEALETADRVLRLDRTNARAWVDKVTALASLARLDEAAAELASARAAARNSLLGLPSGPQRVEQLDPFALYVGRALQRQVVCDWHDRQQLVDTIRQLLAEKQAGKIAETGVLFHALALPLSRVELGQLADAVAAPLHATKPEAGPAPSPNAERSRIKVGFLSPDFKEHPGARLLRRLFLDRDRDRFEFIAYALNRDDGSAIRAELLAAADSSIDASSWSSGELVERIRGDRLDLLIDQSGYYEGTRPEVLAARVAPVQANFAGTPCTLGPRLLDYRLSDALTTPRDTQRDWHERFVLLPPPHWAYDASQPIGEAGSRMAHGLPGKGVVFCAFNQAFKISPEIFQVWMRLLAHVPRSVLWLLDGGELMRRNLASEAQRAGIAADRLVFAPRVPVEAHLGRLQHADLFVDTLHCNAHTTAVDALHAGVPVITRVGETMASRLAGTFVRCAGLAELAVDSLEDYELRALELARDAARRARLREKLRQARSSAPLFATAERVRAIERAFTAMVERSRAGLPPDTLTID
jgi:protein O-GlcNAc transferase